MICKNCGFEGDGFTFCPMCGSVMEGQKPSGNEPDSEPIPAETEESSSSMLGFTPPPAEASGTDGDAPLFTPLFTPLVPGSEVGDTQTSGAADNDTPDFAPSAEEAPGTDGDEMPTFTPPADDGDATVAMPTFTPPVDEVPGTGADDMPTFTPPVDSVKTVAMPTFTPPADDMPTFTPPADNVKTAAPPTFVPPTTGTDSSGMPVFAPPASVVDYNVPTCEEHKSKRAVATCARCGSHVCQDCVDALGVDAGEYAGQPLCATCMYELVQENNRMLVDQYKRMRYSYIFMAVGAAIGAFLMSMISPGIAMLTGLYSAFGPGSIFVINLFGACAGMGFRLVFRDTIRLFIGARQRDTEQYESIFGKLLAIVFSFLLSFVLCLFIAPIRAAQTLIRYLRYQQQTKNFIEQGNAALDSLEQYMNFMRAQEQNPGADVRVLSQAGGVLENNPYAQTYIESGQQAVESQVRAQASAMARNRVVIEEFEVAENGEVVRKAV